MNPLHLYYLVLYVAMVLFINIRLQVWHIDSVLKNAIAVLQDHTQPVVNSHHSAAISDSWKAPALPCSLTDSLVGNNRMDHNYYYNKLYY